MRLLRNECVNATERVLNFEIHVSSVLHTQLYMLQGSHVFKRLTTFILSRL